MHPSDAKGKCPVVIVGREIRASRRFAEPSIVCGWNGEKDGRVEPVRAGGKKNFKEK